MPRSMPTTIGGTMPIEVIRTVASRAPSFGTNHATTAPATPMAPPMIVGGPAALLAIRAGAGGQLVERSRPLRLPPAQISQRQEHDDAKIEKFHRSVLSFFISC